MRIGTNTKRIVSGIMKPNRGLSCADSRENRTGYPDRAARSVLYQAHKVTVMIRSMVLTNISSPVH